MAVRIPILGWPLRPDDTGETFVEPLSGAVTMANAADQLVMTMKDPSADTGVFGSFHVPQDYDTGGTTKIVVTLIQGAASSGNIGFEFSYLPRGDGEACDAAWTDNDAWTVAGDNVDEQTMETEVTITAADFAVADEVFFYFKRDFSGDGFVGDIHVTGVYFEYTTA
jgi:hypothetical protein